MGWCCSNEAVWLSVCRAVTYTPELEPKAALGSGPVESRYREQWTKTWDDAWQDYENYLRDRMKQDMLNNLWDNNPGELDRWADDGGRA